MVQCNFPSRPIYRHTIFIRLTCIAFLYECVFLVYLSLSGSVLYTKMLCVLAVEVRLAGANRPRTAGRLEIKYDGNWGTVCDDGFVDKNAQVACFMLGFG